VHEDDAYTVGLSAGSTAGATVSQRLMANGAETMRYNLYTDAARSAIWGNASPALVPGTGSGLGSNAPLTVYGRVAAGQAGLAAGNYQDSVTVTVTY
jgi:spore coat protein U-like protein